MTGLWGLERTVQSRIRSSAARDLKTSRPCRSMPALPKQPGQVSPEGSCMHEMPSLLNPIAIADQHQRENRVFDACQSCRISKPRRSEVFDDFDRFLDHLAQFDVGSAPSRVGLQTARHDTCDARRTSLQARAPAHGGDGGRTRLPGFSQSNCMNGDDGWLLFVYVGIRAVAVLRRNNVRDRCAAPRVARQCPQCGGPIS